jgi:Mrp family chromosome partitioning ATPase
MSSPLQAARGRRANQLSRRISPWHHNNPETRVGLCDCDIYGPSIALMFGTRERPTATEENKIVPIEQYGLRLMSMGFLLDDTSPAILRATMVTRYTQQFLRQVEWGEWIISVLICLQAPETFS